MGSDAAQAVIVRGSVARIAAYHYIKSMIDSVYSNFDGVVIKLLDMFEDVALFSSSKFITFVLNVCCLRVS